jgi:hypothetical protein
MPATVILASTSGDQLCLASAARRNGAKSPTRASDALPGNRWRIGETGFERTSGCSLKTGIWLQRAAGDIFAVDRLGGGPIAEGGYPYP